LDNKLPHKWLEDANTEAERTEFKELLLNSQRVLSRLKEILINELEAAERRSLSKDQYETPSWAYQAAHANGYFEGLTKALSLVAFATKPQK
jgi:hypothetical protein